jgi:3-phenylpropionate/trans-cinnamate dioxygenase ferredoxin subunit
MPFVKVATVDQLSDGEVLPVDVDGLAICVIQVDGEVYAFADKCSHRDFPLAHGEVDLDDCSITCEWHGARFDMRTGQALCLPATRPVPVFPCQVQGGDILVDLT